MVHTSSPRARRSGSSLHSPSPPVRPGRAGAGRPALLLALALGIGCRSGPEVLRIPPATDGRAQGSTAPALAQGWRSDLLLDLAPTGIWFAAPFDLYPQYAEPEVLALDDLGRAHVVISYGGRWTLQSTGPEGSWLGTAGQGDVDGRIPGPEAYLGAESGRVWQLVTHRREGVLDRRLVAQLDGRAVHALAVGRFGPLPGQVSVLVFTEPAEAWRLTPRPDRDGFEAELLDGLDGRIRQALTVSGADGRDRVLCASRAGWVGWYDPLATAPERLRPLHRLGFGRGRVVLARGSTFESGRAFSTAEDGTIWEHRWSVDQAPSNQLVYRGPQGPRGIAVGRFDPQTSGDQVAIFGYSGQVELLRPGSDPAALWSSEVLLEDRTPDGVLHRGHFLSSAELDGRNSTDELLLCGFSGRLTLLARLP